MAASTSTDATVHATTEWLAAVHAHAALAGVALKSIRHVLVVQVPEETRQLVRPLSG